MSKANKQNPTEEKSKPEKTVLPQKPGFNSFAHLRNGFKPGNSFSNRGFNPTLFKGPQHKG